MQPKEFMNYRVAVVGPDDTALEVLKRRGAVAGGCARAEGVTAAAVRW